MVADLERDVENIVGQVGQLIEDLPDVPSTRRLKKVTSPKQEVVLRDPLSVGEWMWGCHTEAADQWAAATENNGEIYKLNRELFEKWDAHMTRFTIGTNDLSRENIVREGLRFLLENGEAIHRSTQFEMRHTRFPEMTPDETRDWFCWLLRYFVYMKREQDNGN